MKNTDFQKLNIAYVERDIAWAYCIYHEDIKRPNLSISLSDKYYGRWKCWACGRNGRLNKQQMNKLNLSDCVVYKNDRHNLHTRWEQFNKSCYDNLQNYPLLKLGLAKELNISTESLDEWLVGFDGTSITIPMFREDLPEYGREGGCCGVQRRFPDGAKRCMTGSRLGLMYPYNYPDSYYIFICEGFSDGINVWDLGFSAMSRPHCHYIDGIKEMLCDVLEGIEQVIIIPDNDVVGKEGAEKLYNILKYDYECLVFSFDGAKDIRQYIQEKGKAYVGRELERLNEIGT
uniref:Primase n=1 Tax=viral metagenome TaxID=1070528 RepID=A0A6H1ZYF7_9ZZZZ